MYKDKILKLLGASRSGFVSGEDLAARLGISRTMVWKHIKALEREGFGIEAVPSQGYRITRVPDLLRQDDVKRGLKTTVVGKEIHLYHEVASTNTLAMEMAAQGAQEGAVVIAETQTGGKGRLGRKWISPKGNLYLSVVLRPAVPAHRAPLVTLMGAVAVASAARSQYGVQASIKWPNDVLISGRKVAGLLTEMSAEQDRIKHIVLGIGVDVNMNTAELPEEIRSRTTTLAAEAGRRIDRNDLLRQILSALDHQYQIFLKNDVDVIREWETLNMTTGSRVAVSGLGETITGLAHGIDREGRLIIMLDGGGIRAVAAGDVTILKKA